nr:NADH dehydrogenase [ubiquinone] 1 beta subcomplex subunit 5, mitochondrial [Megalopta genalis]
MTTWSKILFSTGQKFFKPYGLLVKTVPKNNIARCMSHNSMVVKPTDWQYHKFKDWFHFYFFVGLIPILCVVTYANVFIGPATLTPIPEGYVPKEWEYYRSPITRFIARYLYTGTQESYERRLYHCIKMTELRELKKLNRIMHETLAKEQDYNALCFRRDMRAYEIMRYRARLDRREAKQ